MTYLLVLCLLLLLLLLIENDSFKLINRISSNSNSNSYNNNKNIMNNDIINSKRLIKTSLNDQAAFVTPLAISVFTLVPFLIYQQALKPKPRTIKQIELDEQLRPKDKKLTSGKTGSAQAGKKK